MNGERNKGRVSRFPRIRKWCRRIAAGFLIAGALATATYWTLCAIFPFPIEEMEAVRRETISTFVLDRDGNILRAFPGANDTWMLWVGRERISPFLRQATVAVEDERFESHPGVDPIAVVRAAGSNIANGRTVSGASTIPMQVMRLLEDRPRTFDSKIVESFRALQLNGLLGKDEIMEWYLNLAPYGGNVVGVEAAALTYFQKHAVDLTLAEAALLAGLPQSPSKLRPDLYPERTIRRRNHVLKRMRECGFIDDETLAAAREEPVAVSRKPFPFEAPHLAQFARERNPNAKVLQTTIDRRIQRTCSAILREGVDRLRPGGVTNGAVVVIENRTAEVLSLVGSRDFHALEDEGEVNGAVAPRSPGSALKPFTYALAFEQGLCTPGTILADVPAFFKDFEPENFDRVCRGPVTAREALATSLNLPAVTLLQEAGQASLHALLRESGIATLTKGADHYGLALTLGSTEVTLLDLTNSYAALARLGVHRPCRLLRDDPPGEERRILSEGASYLVADILSDADGAGRRALISGANPPKVAWKTGTSYGRRDAWTIAYTPDYTVGVWIGNFSGKPSAELVGIRAAAPVAAGIIEQLYGNRPISWYRMPDQVGSRTVCAVSGRPAGDNCPTTTTDLFIRGRSGDRPCSVHEIAMIDRKTGTRLCRHCADGRAFDVRSVESWPAPLAAWFRQYDGSRVLSPRHFPGCAGGSPVAAPPRILSPADGESYVFLSEIGGNQKLLLQARSDSDRLYWFVDGDLFTSSDVADRTFWALQRGRHTIVCADDVGRSSSVTIDVR